MRYNLACSNSGRVSWPAQQCCGFSLHGPEQTEPCARAQQPWGSPGWALPWSQADWPQPLQTAGFAGRAVPGAPKQFPVLAQVFSRLHMDTNRFALENKGDFKSCGNQYLKKTQITPWGICTKRQFSESKVQNDKAFLLREGWAGSFHHLPLICSRVLCSGVKSSLVQQAKLMSCEIPGHNPTLHVPECPCWPNNPTGGMNSKCACRDTGTATSAWKGVSFKNPNSLQC